MKTYKEAELQVVRLKNNDIVTLSLNTNELKGGSSAIYVGDRFRDFEEDYERY